MKSHEIYVIYGDQPQKMVGELLAQIRPETWFRPHAKIGIKPNLVVPKPAQSGATTSPQIVAGLIEYLQAHGFDDLCILEGSGIGNDTVEAFYRCGYKALSERYKVPLINMQKDETVTRSVAGLDLKIGKSVTELDHLINVPVLKAHCQTKLTCALKNLKGLIPDSEKRRFHTLGLHRPIAALSSLIRQDLILVDGIMGDLTFEEGGHPVRMNRILAARDPVLCDAYAATLLGHEVTDIAYIPMAAKLKVGSSDLSRAAIHSSGDHHDLQEQRRETLHDRFAAQVVEKNACSACYGSLMHALQRLSEQGRVPKRETKLHIGQAFRGDSFNQGIGIGDCAIGFPCHVAGCPPQAKAIVDAIASQPERS